MTAKNFKLIEEHDAERLRLDAERFSLISHHRKIDNIGFDMVLSLMPRATELQAPRLLDLGAMSGDFIKRFLLKYRESSAVYVDVMPHFVEQAKIYLQEFGNRVEFLQSSVEGLPSKWGDGAFDVITGNKVYHYVEREDFVRSFKQCHAMLKDNGMLLVSLTVNFPDMAKEPYKRSFEAQDMGATDFTPAEQARYDELLKKLSAYESDGKAKASHTYKHIKHDLFEVLAMMKEAGFRVADCAAKHYAYAVCMAIK